ncbi:hypothetical protein ACFVWG_01325 [Kribbella sp. NPDC058245]|uniref:hypothetical protein n=1 Tax=Kribbella sp. NPDC058245 TaxID=3346399 RepID=UPI0036EF7D56
MNNDPEVGNELHRLAHAEPLTDFDTNAVLTRGRSGVRRRRFLGVGGGIAGVAAIALAATLIPNLSSAGQDPGVAGTDNSQFEAVPGLPHGEAALFVDVTQAQAQQLCDLRYPGEHQKLKSTTARTHRVGSKPSFEMQKLPANGRHFCQIPGGDKPSAKLVAAAAADPLPKDAAGQLRNCSVQTWVDVTGWRIMAADRSAALKQAQIVAVSPSGRSLIACSLDSREGPMGDMSNTLFSRLQAPDPNLDPILTPASGTKWAEMIVSGYGGGACDSSTKKCGKGSATAWGRGPAETATVEVSLHGKSYRTPATEGWWASTWSIPPHTWTGDPKKPDYPVYKAYDKNGKFLKKLGS